MNPTRFGRYVLLERVASGGMGEVYVALTRSLWGFEKCYAVKKILPSLSQSPEFLARFRDEARLVIPMNHSNVVQVFEVGSVDREYFIAMEFVEGVNLRQLLSKLWRWRHRQRLHVLAALFIIRELLKGLEYCHRCTNSAGLNMKVVHRDVSPANVLVSFDGAVKLTDFGLALSRLKAYKTEPNQLLGHLGYMAPEIVDGRLVDHRADIYGAGVLLFELLTCKRFAPGDDIAVIRAMMKRHSMNSPSTFRSEIPRQVDELVLKAVASDPGERFSTAQHFHDELQKVLIMSDPFFDADRLRKETLVPLFQPAQKQQQLHALIKSVDFEELEAQQPLARTICIAESIPLTQRSTLQQLPEESGEITSQTKPSRVFRGNLVARINKVFEEDNERVEQTTIRPHHSNWGSKPSARRRWSKTNRGLDPAGSTPLGAKSRKARSFRTIRGS